MNKGFKVIKLLDFQKNFIFGMLLTKKIIFYLSQKVIVRSNSNDLTLKILIKEQGRS